MERKRGGVRLKPIEAILDMLLGVAPDFLEGAMARRFWLGQRSRPLHRKKGGEGENCGYRPKMTAPLYTAGHLLLAAAPRSRGRAAWADMEAA